MVSHHDKAIDKAIYIGKKMVSSFSYDIIVRQCLTSAIFFVLQSCLQNWYLVNKVELMVTKLTCIKWSHEMRSFKGNKRYHLANLRY